MALITCKECKNENASGAKVCPKCGHSLKMGLGKKIGIGVAIFFGLGVVNAALKQGSTGSATAAMNPMSERNPGDGRPAPVAAIQVTAMRLFADYQANEVSADDKYKTHKLLITGTVSSIDKGAFGGLHLQLATSNQFMSAMCSMEDSEKPHVAQLSKGDGVTVLCTGGGMIMGSPTLDECKVM